MLTVTSAQLTTWLALFFFPFVRILAMVASSPILGNKQVPVRVKIGLSALLTFIIAPTLESSVNPASAQGLFVLLQQILIGLSMGFTLRLIFTSIEMAGDIIGMQMGLGFAIFYDPQNAAYTPIIAQFLGLLAALIFLSMNGHLYMLETLAQSFHAFPIGETVPAASAFHTLVLWGGNIFATALQLALPVIGVLLITNLALGILTRSAPQLNLFAVGFPITLAVGFVAIILLLPYLTPLLERSSTAGLDTVQRVLQQFAGRAP